ncbi:MAG TPA: NAD(P)/FAD-dependent oxidoreductase, partial [bacterium]
MPSGALTVAVVGAGPAGLVAAGEAAGAGAQVTLLEGGERAGRKLLLTGKGRCNLSNTLSIEEFIAGFGTNGAFLRNGLHRYFTAELRAFLATIGVETAVERGGRVY